MKQISKTQTVFFRAAGIVYGLILLYALFLRSAGRDSPLTYTEYLSAASNFIPLKSVYILLTTPVISARIIIVFLENFIGNILLFIPWGFLLPLYFKKLRIFRRFILTTLTVILLVESVQLFTMLGSFDIEDILLNAIGALTGFWCCKKLLLGKIPT